MAGLGRSFCGVGGGSNLVLLSPSSLIVIVLTDMLFAVRT